MINPFDDVEQEEDRSEPLGGEGCEFPGNCCMPGPHYKSECHTPEMMMEQEEAAKASNRCIESMQYVDYCKAPGIRCSHFKTGRTPAHWLANMQKPKKDTDALRFGGLIHSYIFDGWRPNAIKPAGMSFATKAGKAWKAEHAGEITVTAHEDEAFRGMAAAVQNHKHNGRYYLAEAIEGGQRSLGVFAEHEETGLLRKCLLDLLAHQDQFNDGRPILDLKGVVCADTYEFDNAIRQYGWYTQMSYYVDAANACGLNVERAYLVAVEKTYPYLVRVVDLNDLWLERGRLEYRKRLKMWKQAIETNTWAGYPTEPQISTPPEWFIKGMPDPSGLFTTSEPPEPINETSNDLLV